MKAALFLGPEKMEIKEVKKPECKEGEISIRVKACAICGTDVRIYYHGQKNVKPPHIIGHEIAGVIEDFGSRVRGYQKGEPVIVVTPVGCGKCRLCNKGLHNLCLDFKAIGPIIRIVLIRRGATPPRHLRLAHIIEKRVASIPPSVFYRHGDDHRVLRFCFAKKDETIEKAAEILCRI